MPACIASCAGAWLTFLFVFAFECEHAIGGYSGIRIRIEIRGGIAIGRDEGPAIRLVGLEHALLESFVILTVSP